MNIEEKCTEMPNVGQPFSKYIQSYRKYRCYTGKKDVLNKIDVLNAQ